MRRVAVLAILYGRLVLCDRSALLWMFLMPLLFTFVFGNLGGDQTEERRRRSLPVRIEDDGFLGGALFRALDDANWAPYRVARSDSEFADLPLWIEVPAGFTEKILAGEEAKIRVVERQNRRALAREGFAMDAWKAVLCVLSNLAAIPDSLAGRLTDAEFEARYDSAAALPRQITLEARFAEGAREVPEGFLLSVPGNLVMFVLIVALTSGAANVAVETSKGHLRRLASSPVPRLEIFLGKLFGQALVAAVQVVVLVTLATILFPMHWGRQLPGIFAVLFLFALVASSIGVFLGLSIRKPETAAATGVLVTLVMAALGGCWWPLEIVSGSMRAVGHAFPTAWAMDAIFALTAYGRPFPAIFPNLLFLAAYALLFALLASRRLRFDT